jgi:hypothetical protein
MRPGIAGDNNPTAAKSNRTKVAGSGTGPVTLPPALLPGTGEHAEKADAREHECRWFGHRRPRRHGRFSHAIGIEGRESVQPLEMLFRTIAYLRG